MGIKTVQKSNNVGQKPELSIFEQKFDTRYFLGGVFTPTSHPSCENPNCGPDYIIDQTERIHFLIIEWTFLAKYSHGKEIELKKIVKIIHNLNVSTKGGRSLHPMYCNIHLHSKFVKIIFKKSTQTVNKI